MQDKLRKEVKLLKALQGISYKDIATDLEIKTNSLYSWLRGYYSLSFEKYTRLQEIVSILKDD